MQGGDSRGLVQLKCWPASLSNEFVCSGAHAGWQIWVFTWSTHLGNHDENFCFHRSWFGTASQLRLFHVALLLPQLFRPAMIARLFSPSMWWRCRRSSRFNEISSWENAELLRTKHINMLPRNEAKPACTTPRAKQRCSDAVSVAGDSRLPVRLISRHLDRLWHELQIENIVEPSRS